MVEGKSPNSQSDKKSAKISFTIEWQDPCNYSELLPAFFSDSPLTIDLFSTLSIGYGSMLDMTGNDCGGYTNTFNY